MAGLRERKQAETRQRISDHATRLFERQGFENVTLAQVAAAAGVSVKTVTNYFGAKDELFFDTEPAVLDHLVTTVRGLTPAAATAALRPLVLDGPLLAGPCRWDTVDAATWEAMRVWARCERDSPALTVRRAALTQGWSHPLAEAVGSRAWGALAAGTLALRQDVAQSGLVADHPPERVGADVRAAAGAALDALERGFA
ncbi:TetR/AcrR family transcriptional regulator [Streptomyces sp. NPDC021224]|uniref:TetR/AcrR family transcriptional regulator n=1 Tax=unclassified Streptomyces TaxID=2593676 RepID=UPI00378921BD